MKSRYQKNRFFAAIAVAGFAFAAPSAHAADLTWDAVAGDGTDITAGSGTWDTSATAWNDAGSDVAWSQTDTITPLNTAIFAGADGTVDQYGVALGSQMAASGITFNSSGYQITGSTLSLGILTGATGTNGAITVAASKTATIDSTLKYTHNRPATVTVGAGGILNLGGGTTATFNPQLNLSGAGTVNITAGTYASNIGSVANAIFNQTGGIYNITPGNNAGFNITSATQNVAYNLSVGTLSVNGNASTATVNNAFFGIGNGTSTFTSSLNVSGTSIMNVGTTASRSGEIRIGNTAASNGTLDVSGGTVTVGTGSAANKIYLFKAGSGADFTATMTQSDGTVTTNGIQFGGSTGATTYNATSAANLTLTGGNLYIGAAGITKGSDAASLATTIQLQNGTLGASAAWSSSLDMKLGTATIRSANSGGTAQNITLSGILSDDSGPGTLTKTGSGSLTLSGLNEFTGATAVNQGTLVLANSDALSTSSSLTIADAAALSLTTTPSTVKTLTFTNTGTLNYDLAGGGTTLTVNTSNGVTNSGAAGSITINITGTAPANGTYTLVSYSGSLQGSGFSAYQLGTFPAGKSYSLFNAAGAVQLVVADPYFWTGAQTSEWSTNTIAGLKNWTQGASPADYVNGAAVIFDDSATTYTVDVSVADVTPASVIFNNNGATPYTLQGSKAIAGSASLTKLGSQTLQISNPNTYTGATTISAGTLKLGASEVLPDGIGTGNVTIDGSLDLNGFSETINGLSGAVSGGVDNTAVGPVTLTVGNGDGSGSIFGIIQNTGGSLGIVKTGSGQLFLRGNSSFTGGVLVKNGSLNGGTSANAIGTGGVTLGGSGSTGAAFIGGQDFSANVNVTVNPHDSGTCVIGANGAGSNMQIGSITLNNADVTVETFTAATTAATTVKGGVTGTGNLLLNNLTTNTSSNRVIFLAATVVNHTGTITAQGTGTTTNYIGADIGSNVTGVIQNSATALLLLDGINSYSGNTTVNAGILRINKAADPLNANPNNDASTVSIASGAQMNLQYTGTDIVDKLFYDAVQQPSGEYSASSVPPGATIPTNRFLGGGTLTVSSSPGGSYASWIDSFFPGETNPAIIGAGADPDRDGIDNGVEMVIGGDPKLGMDTALLPTIELVTNPVSTPAIPAGNYLLFTYRRSDLSVAAGVTATCETDTDLVAPWTVATDGVSGTVIQVDDNFTFNPPAAADTDRVRVYVPRGANTKLFGRLDVQVP
ncbi:MAG: autotransporter-associated beta strand repeat-containing protein [Akkermansiaceae bacterium]